MYFVDEEIRNSFQWKRRQTQAIEYRVFDHLVQLTVLPPSFLLRLECSGVICSILNRSALS